MIVSNNFAVPYYLNVRKEKGMTAYYWATHQSQLATQLIISFLYLEIYSD